MHTHLTQTVTVLLALAALLVLGACATTHESGPPTLEEGSVREGGYERAPDGDGVCCPISSFRGCSPQHESAGGWASSPEACTRELTFYDGCPVIEEADEHGCAALIDRGLSCDDVCGSPLIEDDGGVDGGGADRLCEGVPTGTCGPNEFGGRQCCNGPCAIPCCIDGRLETCEIPSGYECTAPPPVDCGAGTCVQASTMCPGDAVDAGVDAG